MTYYNEEMTIRLDAPMEMAELNWPTGTAGKLLPVPKSTIGKFSYEHDDSFFVYVGDTSRTDYEEYITSCSDSGFSVNYDKGDNYYSADNTDGWHVSIRYEGNNIMTVDISAPSDADDSSASAKTSEAKENTTAENEEAADTTQDGGSIGAEFKAAMDSYEEFMDEYVEFMNTYNSNPSDPELMSAYADYVSKYSQFVSDFEKWDDEELNAAETAYYAEVQARVTQKLLEIAQ